MLIKDIYPLVLVPFHVAQEVPLGVACQGDQVAPGVSFQAQGVALGLAPLGAHEDHRVEA